MNIHKKTNYPNTISVTPAQLRAIKNGKVKSIIIYSAVTGDVLKRVTNPKSLLKNIRTIFRRDSDVVKYHVLRFQ